MRTAIFEKLDYLTGDWVNADAWVETR
jgi:hypothetical protein